MNKHHQKEPLYRKVNSKARNARHFTGVDFKYLRHKRRETREQTKGSMHGKKERGLDYTPLFRFLLSRVGQNWDDIFSEANARLDKAEPIFWLVSLNEKDKKDIVRLGEASFYSGLYVDDNGLLQLTNSRIEPTDLKHYCVCCTHTFNGQVY